MRLTRAQATARATLLDLLARPPLDPITLGRLIAATLREAVGWDGYRLYALDPRTGIFSRLLDAVDGDQASRAIWLRETHLNMDSAIISTVERMIPDRQPARVLAMQTRLEECHGWDMSAWEDEERQRFRRVFMEGTERYHLPGQLIASLTMIPRFGEQQIAHLVVWRFAPGRPFSAGEVAFLNLVCGTVGELIRAALQAERRRPVREPIPVGSGIVIVSPGGDVSYTNPAGAGWLGLLRSSDPLAATTLPAQIWSAMALLRTDVGEATLRTVVPGMAVTIEATPGGNGATALVITPTLAAPAIGVPTSWQLTAAQRRVCELVGHGLTNREVAERLSISENTVVWHLSHIFASTGIPNRTQLAARLLHGNGAATG